jgi:sugar transferase (PEP-CTERM/EpsH1 system associated)
MNDTSRGLIVHVVHRLDYGGLENGLVNLINRLPDDRLRHAVVCLAGYTTFAERLEKDVELVDLNKQPGKDLGLYVRLYRTFRRLRPALVHTRNLATIEAQLPAFLAGVPARVHGEHGWDVHDLGGVNPRYRLLRRAVRPLVQRYVPLSGELERYLVDRIGVAPAKITRICNGVDLERFRPRRLSDDSPWPAGFAAEDAIVIGSVGRMEEVKDPLNLVDAFLELWRRDAPWSERLRLVMVGDGRLREEAVRRLEAAGAADRAWLPGARSDTPELLRAMDLFVLPSLAEGISNTILEAMASGLAIVATVVGGNAELVEEGRTACLVPSASPSALADAVASYLGEPRRLREHGEAARRRAEARFGIDDMVARYLGVYEGLLGVRRTL